MKQAELEFGDRPGELDLFRPTAPAVCRCPVPVVGADLDLHTSDCPRPNHWHAIGEPCGGDCESES